MATIREWLEQVGLDRYAEAFEHHQVTPDIAADLHEDDLKDIGVASLGHRKQLLRAFAAPPVETASPVRSVDAAPKSQDEVGLDHAERRQITVLFCDLVGSTRLSERLDPEDLSNLIGAYRQAAAAVVERYQGHVAQYQGDGMLAYFGWPRAHEDDAGRAVRAGLEVISAVEAIRPAEPLKVRVGAATGSVVVGRATADVAQEELAVGETPGIAEQMQALAGAGELVISASTQHLVGGAFDLSALNDDAAPGASEPVAGWRVAGLSETDGRFEAHAHAATPLVGRDTELALIRDRWQRAKEGEGQVFLLGGEPGIGKSRVVRAFRDELTAEPSFRFRYQCLSYYTNSILHPIRQHFERVAGFLPDDDDRARIDKLELALAESVRNNPESVSLMAAMLSIDIGDRYPPLNLTPQTQKELILRDLVEQIIGLAKKRPVLMIFEDTHWIDPTSQQALDLMVPRLAAHRVLMLITHRPGYEPAWSRLGHVSRVSLSRLGRRQAATIARNVDSDVALPAPILDQIIAKADGVPLFVEELTKALIESGIAADNDSPVRPQVSIPATLQDSLMARLDQLGPGRQVAQIGACIGRKFGHELLVSITQMPADRLDPALAALLDSGMVYRAGTPPEATYSFRHALAQDTAYASLLKRNRREIHGRIATALAEGQGGEPEIVAHHFALADQPAKAVPLLVAAGRAAIGRSAGDEALAHLERARTLLDKTETSPERDQQEAMLHMMIGNALIPRSGYTNPETHEAFKKAYGLARKLNDPTTLPAALYGLWVNQWMCAKYAASIDPAVEALTFAESVGDSGLLVVAHRMAGMSYGALGELETARDHLRTAVDLYDSAAHGHLALAFGQDPGVAALSNLSLVLWYLGYTDQAFAAADQAIALAEQSGHPQTLTYAHSNRAYFDYFREDLTALAVSVERTAELAEIHRLGFYAGLKAPMQAWLQANAGDPASVLDEYNDGLEAIRQTGNIVTIGVQLAGLARCYAMAGRKDDAMATINRTIAEAEACEEYYSLPFLHIAKADCELIAKPANKAEAEASFHRAIELASAQKNRAWQLRAATALADLWRGQGRDGDAHAVLAPVYDEFTEGFDSPELKHAKSLLDQLTR